MSIDALMCEPIHQQLSLPAPKPSIPGAKVPNLETAARQALVLLSVQRAVAIERGQSQQTGLIEDACWALQSALDGLDEERREMLAPLCTPESAHVAMLRGIVAVPSLRNCAHAHGAAELRAFMALEPQYEENLKREKALVAVGA